MIRISTSIQCVFGLLLVVAVAAGCGEAVPSASSVGENAPNSKQATPSYTAPRPSTVPPTPQVSFSPGHRDVGILDRHGGPFPASLFGVVNQYSGPYQGQWLMIYAGGDRDPSQVSDPFIQGAIRIDIEPAASAAGSPTYIGEFDAPQSPTWVKLIDVSGSTVTLQRQDGSKVTFNLTDHSFSR